MRMGVGAAWRLVASLIAVACNPAHADGVQVHQAGRIRVIYETTGPGAVRTEDRNGNGIPDQVDDVMTQATAAQALFVEALGFPDPFCTGRFGPARYLDIRIRDRAILKANGVAYDELQPSGVRSDPVGTRCIAFCVASAVNAAENLTPAHEYFHLIEYGASHFKNRWYAEGLARWSERGLGTGGVGRIESPEPWPLPDDGRTNLFAQSYGAAGRFWNPLASRLDPGGRIPAGEALDRLRAMRYADGSPVLKDDALAGWAFVRDVIVELGRADGVAFRELGYDRWSEEHQFSARNDAYILRAVEAVVARHETTPATDAAARVGVPAGELTPVATPRRLAVP